MEFPQEYPLASISPLSPSSSSPPSCFPISPVVAVFCIDSERFSELRFEFDQDSENNVLINFDLRTVQLFKLDVVQSLCVSEGETSEEAPC